MLNSIKSFIKETLNNFGYELQKSKLLTTSDEPFFVLSKLLCPDEVKSIADAGASIGETPKLLSKFDETIDLYLLANCNLVVGPPSSFSSWAVFYGNSKRGCVLDENQILTVNTP
jgi:hypothetical protein